MKLWCTLPTAVRIAAYLLAAGFVLGVALGYRLAEAAMAASAV